METPRSELAPPERFELGAPLGRGAVGVVHRAWDRVLGHEVALKLLLVDRPTPTQMERFRREGELSRAIEHPHVVRLLAAASYQGKPCLAFELVEQARTLREALPGLAPRRVVELLRDAARALGAAHRLAVVHRDVKLDNLLLDGRGQLKVTDFGVATAAHLARLTRSGALVGTPQALAPEQVSGGALSPATDVWALGVALHEALLGEPPFEGEDMLQLLQQIMDAPLASPARQGVDAGLAAIVERCLEKDPARRYADGDAVADALEAWLAGNAPARATARRGGGRGVVIGLGVLLAAVLGAVALASRAHAARRAQACAALERAVWSALGSGSSVAAASSGLAAREAELAALDAGGQDPALARARGGVWLTRALARLVAGDPAVEPAQDGDALAEVVVRGGLAALQPTGDAEAAWAGLTQAIAGGVAPDELRVWRARAALRLPEPGPERLGAALSDLRDLAAGLGRDGQLLRAELALRAGDLELAGACLAGVADPPPALGWRLVLAEVWRGDPLLAEPRALAERLEALGPQGRPDTAALRLLLQQVDGTWREAVFRATRGGDRRALSVFQRATLIELGRIYRALGQELSQSELLTLWDAASETDPLSLCAHLALLGRVRELSPPEAVEALWGPSVELLAHGALAAGGGRGLEDMPALIPEPWLRARVRFLRGVDRRVHGQWEGALEDLRAAQSWLDDPRLLGVWEARHAGLARSELAYNLALALEAGGAPQEAADQAFAALSAPLGLHLAGAADVFHAETAMDVVWRCAFPTRPALVRQALETRLAGGLGRPQNWVRLARVDLLEGDALRAESRLTQVQPFADAFGEAAQAAVLAAHRALQVEGAPEGDARLAALEALVRTQ